MKRIFGPLLAWARQLKADVVALWIAARDKRTPLPAKLVAGAVAAYALSPIDLIPDFLPVIGQLDELVILPLGIWLAIRLIPTVLMTEFRNIAKLRAERPTSTKAALLIIAVWSVSLAVGAVVAWPFIRSRL